MSILKPYSTTCIWWFLIISIHKILLCHFQLILYHLNNCCEDAAHKWVFISPQPMLHQLIQLWYYYHLTHWDRDESDNIPQKTFSNIFSPMKMFDFGLNFHWRLFLRVRVQLTIFQHWVRSWLGAFQATRHYLNQWWLVYWRIYASLGFNALNICCLKKFGAFWNIDFSNCIHKQSVEFYCPSLSVYLWKIWLRENAL